MKIERNSPCPCGSSKKYKNCCLMSKTKPVQITTVSSKVHEDCNNILTKIEAGNLRIAEIEAEHLYNLYPNDHMVNFLRGVCFIQRERYQGAIYFFKKAIKINPWFNEAYYNLANLYRKELKIAQSIDCFRKIIEIDGEHGDLGKLAKKELDQLEKMFLETSGQTLEECVQGSKLFDEAFDCLRKEDYQQAIVLFQQVLGLDPKHVQSYGNMALAHSALGEQKIALQYLDKALLLDPNYEPAQQNREIIIQLKEGEKFLFQTKEIFYYKEKFESKERIKQKHRALSWSPAQASYVYKD